MAELLQLKINVTGIPGMKQMVERIAQEAVIELPEDDEDDFNPYDISGGNFDDAYYAGVEAGYTLFARELVEICNSTKENEQ